MKEAGGNLPEGTLFVVSTPIGNLQDMTLRAADVLSNVDLIAAEDTRHTRVLLQHYDIRTPMTSYHDFNKAKKIPILIEKLKGGTKIAVVSDAGTPGISDPAYKLIEACVENNVPIEVIPGATAFVSALILSSLPTDRFAFEGFLPRKKGRRKRIEALKDDPRTLIFYESPYRLAKTIEDLAHAFGNRRAALIKEITKKFQEVNRGTLLELKSRLTEMVIKGEFVLVVEGKGKDWKSE
ncbi:16S rRNA (cytidine(1402)-2'-O)-methyltransferase [candidate division KSB1 bacterium]|nr:16S rRNA (cytidine(1402)-2'-O)-methyltransferase [candidate division KSB1 bacterium]NIR69961.1 16S rRNA (cytidine(1402)-2'-O)-methyltransferase [candidate division KSB1 bacterium]NIS25860.1 16S rRNA (cytidine(1402)-2'-O)-methyltransferase [candidate division KSB1 bacterium]NIT72737.1 16S rRNA (cytidine(1402)-2'-O)-methyltransferase [candidate division KSB1 bacterium]NIU26549.1 16S rRNA (cytidine(1402)-2'-O)-methyltransferase [candidate division KSB1 bacterium]